MRASEAMRISSWRGEFADEGGELFPLVDGAAVKAERGCDGGDCVA